MMKCRITIETDGLSANERQALLNFVQLAMWQRGLLKEVPLVVKTAEQAAKGGVINAFKGPAYMNQLVTTMAADVLKGDLDMFVCVESKILSEPTDEFAGDDDQEESPTTAAPPSARKAFRAVPAVPAGELPSIMTLMSGEGSFKLKRSSLWCRLPEYKICTSQRMHIVAMTDEAAQFIAWQYYTPHDVMKELAVFGPFTLNIGYIEDADPHVETARLAWRFKEDKLPTDEPTKRHWFNLIHDITAKFVAWQALAPDIRQIDARRNMLLNPGEYALRRQGK